jgi:glyoxylase-like metal-dependent hydrolase (beta-lactamase superfamily II)
MEESKMARNSMPRARVVLMPCIFMLATFAFATEVTPFNASALVKLGDNVRYGSYKIIKIGEGVYQINDRDSHQSNGKIGALGVDMYLICGEKKALMIDLGNDYIDGYAGDNLLPRKNAAEELRAIVYGLAGKRPLEITVTHMHTDHDGMTGAFMNRNVTFWVSDGEDVTGLQKQHNIDPSIYSPFTCGKKSFDLGGGRVVGTFLVKGHTNGGTVYILKKEVIFFTGDAFGNGEGLGISTGEKAKSLAEDSQKLLDYISANFSPYERYALRVYTGHSWENGYGGIYKENIDPIDVGYLDWRFLQNMSACANGVIMGKWLVEGSGLRFVEWSVDPKSGNYNPSARPGERRGVMIFGIGSIMISLQAAYDAAGLQMPHFESSKSPSEN